MDTQAATAPSLAPAKRRTGRLPLAAGAPIALRRSICVHARLHASSCRACADACPVSALEMQAQGPVLHGDCTGCGRCQAACPTGALAARGFEVLQAPGGAGAVGPATLACMRSADLVRPATLRVPCLGGISEAGLLELCAAMLPHPVVVLDEGVCSSCDSGGAEHPAAATVRRVADWLRQAGLGEAALPRMRRLIRPATTPAVDPMQLPGRARRGFLAALVRPAAAVSRTPREDAFAPRQQAIRTLGHLAREYGGRIAPDLLQRVSIGDACRGLRICAATCPTGALRRYRDEQAATAGVSFAVADCVACGNCAAACPQQALQLAPGGDPAAGRQLLTRFVQRECRDCGTRFQVADDAAQLRCENCRKTAALARAAFHTLFAQDTHSGARSALQEELR